MIDLKNTYIKNDRGELRDLYIDECEKQGIKVATSNRGLLNDVNYILTYALSGDYKVEYTNTYDNYFLDKEVTLSDLKPRTKVEYVKCDFEHKWEAVKFMEETEETLYTRPNDEYIELMVCESAVKKMRQGTTLYRRVESEVTWQGELIGLLESNGVKHTDQICLIPEEVIIKLSHLVASLTDKPD